MTRLSSVTLFTLLGIYASHSFAQSITACPTAETIAQDSTGATFAICPNSDYQGWSSQVVPNIASAKDCVTYCAGYSGCTKAVYDHIYKYCHVKGTPNSVNWVQSTQFDTIRPYNGPISACPTAETNVKDSSGRTWAICPSSDYQGNTVTYTPGIKSNEDCIALCAASNGCTKAVYDRIEQGCHLKSGGLTWVGSTRYNSMRLISDSSPGQAVTCSQGSVLTTSDGSQFALCPGTDWQGPSTYVLWETRSNQACAEACSLTPICKRAIYDQQAGACHIKGDASQLTQATDARFNQINLLKKATPIKQANNIGGSWSNVINLPVVAGGAYVVPQQPQANRVLVFSANADMSFGSRTGLTKFADYNFVNGATSAMTVSNTQHDMFCPGISMLTDGQVIVTGGSDASITSIYNPSSNAFVRGPDMKISRGYQSSTILSNGKVFTIGGSWSGGTFSKNGEVYDPSSNTWTLLNGANANAINTADSDYRRDNHAWLHPWSDASVFHAGPSKQMNWFTTSGSGSVNGAGNRNNTNDAMCATNVMYDSGKILAAGGTLVYDDSPGQTTSYLISISSVGQAATVEKVADMKYSRAFANSVVLPDGGVVVLGGQKRSRQFTDIESAVYPEVFNPTTKTWKVLNPQAIPRNYHSTALLLGDGTIFSAGGGLCYVTSGNDNDWGCDPSANHANAEIFSPPYLFNSDGSRATRPTISRLATTSDANNGNWVRAGGTLTVTVTTGDTSGMTFSLVRMGSATHSINTDQRRLSLTARQTSSGTSSSYSIKLPSDYGVLLPGYWYLFAMNKNGVPSVARVVQVKL